MALKLKLLVLLGVIFLLLNDWLPLLNRKTKGETISFSCESVTNNTNTNNVQIKIWFIQFIEYLLNIYVHLVNAYCSYS